MFLKKNCFSATFLKFNYIKFQKTSNKNWKSGNILWIFKKITQDFLKVCQNLPNLESFWKIQLNLPEFNNLFKNSAKFDSCCQIFSKICKIRQFLTNFKKNWWIHKKIDFIYFNSSIKYLSHFFIIFKALLIFWYFTNKNNYDARLTLGRSTLMPTRSRLDIIKTEIPWDFFECLRGKIFHIFIYRKKKLTKIPLHNKNSSNREKKKKYIYKKSTS